MAPIKMSFFVCINVHILLVAFFYITNNHLIGHPTRLVNIGKYV